MENINPTWKVLTSLIFNLKAGHSVKSSIQLSSVHLSNILENFLFRWVHTTPLEQPEPKNLKTQGLTQHQIVLIQILFEGLEGAPILEGLVHLEGDVRQAYERELNGHIAKLPFLGMIPLMLLIGPAFLLLLIGPILSQLLQELSK